MAPFVGAVLSVAMFDDPVTPSLIAAGALMALGVYLHISERHKHERQHAHRPDDPAGEPHTHRHRHAPMMHRHPHYPDLHHRHSH
jgi:hypothetical protein